MIKKIAWRLFATLMVALFIWIGLSWFEVISKNLSPDPTYSPYNAIVLLVEGTK